MLCHLMNKKNISVWSCTQYCFLTGIATYDGYIRLSKETEYERTNILVLCNNPRRGNTSLMRVLMQANKRCLSLKTWSTCIAKTKDLKNITGLCICFAIILSRLGIFHNFIFDNTMHLRSDTGYDSMDNIRSTPA